MRSVWLLVAGLFFLAGCGGEPYFLTEYEIADLEIESGERVSFHVTEPHSSLGKPIEGVIIQFFVPVSDEYSLDDVVAEIMGVAEGQGWDVEERTGGGCGGFGPARVSPGLSEESATLSILCMETWVKESHVSEKQVKTQVVAVSLSPAWGE